MKTPRARKYNFSINSPPNGIMRVEEYSSHQIANNLFAAAEPKTTQIKRASNIFTSIPFARWITHLRVGTYTRKKDDIIGPPESTGPA